MGGSGGEPSWRPLLATVYRPRNGGTWRPNGKATICPGPGLGGSTVNFNFGDSAWEFNRAYSGLNLPFRPARVVDGGTNAWGARNGDTDACFRGVYGVETEKCTSELKLKIEVCNCNKDPTKAKLCKTKDGKSKELVRFKIS